MSDDVRYLPPEENALEEFRKANCTYGDLLSHEWLHEVFGITMLPPDVPILPKVKDEHDIKYMACVTAFKNLLLVEEQLDLESVPGQGYRILSPQEQHKRAEREWWKKNRKITRSTMKSLHYMRMHELSEDERKSAADTMARMGFMQRSIQNAKRKLKEAEGLIDAATNGHQKIEGNQE